MEAAERIAVKWASPEAPTDSLSGGNQQKLLVARWLLAQQGKAILLISSELPELFGVADRILVMRRGKLVGISTNIQLVGIGAIIIGAVALDRVARSRATP